MFNKIRDRHLKPVLWVVTVIIVITFGFWGAVSYIKGRQNPTIGTINGKPISVLDADYYGKMEKLAQELIMFNAQFPALECVRNPKDAGTYLTLLWKANKEKVAVDDQEVIAVIKKWFSRGGHLDKTGYLRFLDFGIRMPPNMFEGYIADFIKIDKLLKKHVKNDISEADVKEAFAHDTQKAKIAYVLFAGENYADSVKVSDADVKSFYEQNQQQFKDDNGTPKLDTIKDKVTQQYKEAAARQNAYDDATRVLARLTSDNKIKDLKDLKLPAQARYAETREFRRGDYIEGIGLDQRIGAVAFKVDIGQINKELMVSPRGVYIIQLLSRGEFDTKKFAAVKDKYAEALRQANAADAEAEFIENVKTEAKLVIFETKKPGSGKTAEKSQTQEISIPLSQPPTDDQ